MDEETLSGIRRLVGPVKAEELKAVDCFVSPKVALFVPAVGQCGYAITPSHSHPAYSFVVTFDPASPLWPKHLRIPEGMFGATAMSPDVPHQEEPSEEFTRYIAIMIDRELFERVHSEYCPLPTAPYCWTPLAVGAATISIFKEFMREAEGDLGGREEMLDAMGRQITHQLVRGLCSVRANRSEAADRVEIARAIELMHARFHEKLTVAVLAGETCLSPSHLTRLFKSETGLSPMEYLRNIRITKARKLLRTGDANVTEVAHQCGFSGSAHFATVFRKHTGRSPSSFRREV